MGGAILILRRLRKRRELGEERLRREKELGMRFRKSKKLSWRRLRGRRAL